MNFTYKSPQFEKPKPVLLDPGWYDFDVVNCYDTDQSGQALISKSDTPYLKLVCQETEQKAIVMELLFLDDDNARKISAWLYACNVTIEDGAQIDVKASTFKNGSFRGRVEINDGFEGVSRNRIIRVVRLEDEIIETPVEDDPIEF